jgi:glycosyltransferase involved in cell wall biosynthesis
MLYQQQVNRLRTNHFGSMKFLSSAPFWYGDKSGFYSQLPKHVAATGRPVEVHLPDRRLKSRVCGKLIAWKHSLPPRDQSLTWVEWNFRKSIERNPLTLHHALSLETNLPMLNYWKHSPQNLVGTIHFPRELWAQEKLDSLRRLSSGIVLYQKDIGFFESVIGKGRVQFVHHGVDTEYFVPRLLPENSEIVEVIYTGQFYRNFDMASRVVCRLSARYPNIIFHFVVPEERKGQARSMPYFQAIANSPAIRWHSGISSGELLGLYQRCHFMLLPLEASGANNAVVEALACGLPIVTTNVGGVGDYGGGSIYPVVPNNDDDGMIAVAERYIGDHAWRHEVSIRARQFAERQLSWPLVARRYLTACEELADRRRFEKEAA